MAMLQPPLAFAWEVSNAETLDGRLVLALQNETFPVVLTPDGEASADGKAVFRMQVRDDPASATVWLTLASTRGDITIAAQDNAAKTLTLSLVALPNAMMIGDFVADVVMDRNGKTTRVADGTIKFTQGLTRNAEDATLGLWVTSFNKSTMRQWKMALMNAGQLAFVDASIPASVVDPLRIQWSSGQTVLKDDLVWTKTAAVTAYTPQAMLDFLAVARQLPE